MRLRLRIMTFLMSNKQNLTNVSMQMNAIETKVVLGYGPSQILT